MQDRLFPIRAVMKELQAPGLPTGGLLPSEAKTTVQQAHYVASRINHLSHERQRRRSWYANPAGRITALRDKLSPIGQELADLYEIKRELRGRVERAHRIAMLRPAAKPSALSAPQGGASRL